MYWGRASERESSFHHLAIAGDNDLAAGFAPKQRTENGWKPEDELLLTGLVGGCVIQVSPTCKSRWTLAV